MLNHISETLNYNIANVASKSRNVDSTLKRHCAEMSNVRWIYILQILQFNIDSIFIQRIYNVNFIYIMYISYFQKA